MSIGKEFGTRMKIKAAKKAPIFKLNSTSLKLFDSSKLKRGLIIYFYPRDNTPGCTLETKDFARLYKKFKSLNYEVLQNRFLDLNSNTNKYHQQRSLPRL